MTNTPYGDWNSKDRTLTIGPAQFQWYKEAEQCQDAGINRALDEQLTWLKKAFGPSEIRLVVDYNIR